MTKPLAPLPPFTDAEKKFWDSLSETEKSELDEYRLDYLDFYVDEWSADLPDEERIPLELDADLITVVGIRRAGG